VLAAPAREKKEFVMQSFPITATPRLRVALPAGSVSISAVEGASETTVDLRPVRGGDDVAARLLETAKVTAEGDTVIVEIPGDRGLFRSRVPAVHCVVHTAADAVLDVGVASADVEVRGRAGDAKLTTASGDVHVAESSGRVEISGASGDIRVDAVAGDLSVTTASGDVAVGEVRGDVSAKSASGDVRVGVAHGSVRHSSASGDLTVDAARGRTITAQTASGDVSVGVASGVTAWLDLSAVSGQVRSDLAVSDDRPDDGAEPLTVRVRTVSGDILVRRSQRAGV
jgi:Putative adhesin